MKYFTDSPYERMMMKIPRPQKDPPKKASSSLKEKPSDKRASDSLKEKNKERGVNVKRYICENRCTLSPKQIGMRSRP